MQFRSLLSAALCLAFTWSGIAQVTFPTNGVVAKSHVAYAFTNATIYVDYQTILENATLIIRDGKVEAVGTKIDLPADAIVTDLKGKFIYPGLVESYSNYGMPEVRRNRDNPGPQLESATKGAYAWNQSLKPETDASRLFTYNKDKAAELRKLGFSTALTFYNDGIARGTSAVVLLGEDKETQLLIKEKANAHYSFNKGNSTQDYPSSLMGSIALLRQTYLDGLWYKNEKAKLQEMNLSLEAWNQNQNLSSIFEVGDKLSALRADKLGDEFKTQYILKGGGDEYQLLDEIKATNATFILPVNFPDAYEVEDVYESWEIAFEDLKHWELAPSNPAMLQKAGVRFALTSADLKDKSDFWTKVRKSVERGLSESDALKALTLTPAEIAGVSSLTGALKPGMLANFLVTSHKLFDKKNQIYENWIRGKQYIINERQTIDLRGTYTMKIADKPGYTLEIKGEIAKPEAKLIAPKDTTKINVDISQQRQFVTLSYSADKKNPIKNRLSGRLDGFTLSGEAAFQDGSYASWSATQTSPFTEEIKKDSTKADSSSLGKVLFPFSAYGNEQLPTQEKVLFKNATVWTNEKEGVLKETDVLIEKGKIVSIGKNLDPAGARVIDATGKHLTPGIIDEHSHIAISKGVNEGTQSVTAEVSIADVVNNEDINIYRQLAGGVVGAQLLHGSANCIGGQSALIKLRWGMSPEKMKIAGADGFIKFALGENVKQSNWGDLNTVRFPQTRMGVEQTFYDAFIRAKEYKKNLADYNGSKTQPAPRRDIELEVLNEILENKRFITCHSYVQSEVNMLMHVADSMGFKVNTFTHILEGYKVADKMKKHGVGGSTFSDWWAYKWEVNDAIPYNAAMLNKVGVVTAINSDDAEMGRRLNQEAAKTVKYGGVSEEDALKMVTLNPAKLLHLDSKMGSIKPGKDADLVLWNGPPLSIYTKADYTFVDGVCYFDKDKDVAARRSMAEERTRILQKMIKAKKNGEKTQKPETKTYREYHCETVDEEVVD
ncbi:MAG: amidohydrolase family protein [Bacteroidia bacterium]|nr:amidohydrolase family protein [Bacteroidia bacterium]